MSRWFRIYDEILDDPKVQGLDPATFKAWVNANCVAAKFPDSRISDRDMAWRLRLSDSEWKATKAELVAAGLIDEQNKPTSDLADKSSLRLPAAEWAKTRARIFARDDYTCRYCGARGVDLQCDHVIPVTRAGSNDDSNLVTSCRPCNAAKRDKIVSIEEWSRARRAAS